MITGPEEFWSHPVFTTRHNPVLHILANECHQSVKTVADVYNIKPYQIASSSSFAIKNLFWSYFTTTMVNVNQPVILTSCVDRILMTFFI